MVSKASGGTACSRSWTRARGGSSVERATNRRPSAEKNRLPQLRAGIISSAEDLATGQMKTLRSLLPLTNWRPSGLKAAHQTSLP